VTADKFYSRSCYELSITALASTSRRSRKTGASFIADAENADLAGAYRVVGISLVRLRR